jgi:ribosome-associated translation inhibitor RaiA
VVPDFEITDAFIQEVENKSMKLEYYFWTHKKMETQTLSSAW